MGAGAAPAVKPEVSVIQPGWQHLAGCTQVLVLVLSSCTWPIDELFTGSASLTPRCCVVLNQTMHNLSTKMAAFINTTRMWAEACRYSLS